MFNPVQVIEVNIWGKRAGAAALDPNLGYYVFEYDSRFKATGIELAPLAMPLAGVRGAFVFTDLPELTFKRLPALLADALPDDFGNALIDAWMAEKGVAREHVTPLDRLAYMGRRAMGALEFRPARSPAAESFTAMEMSRLVEGARRALRGELDSEHLAKAALNQMIRVGTSAGGARAKAVIAWNPATGEIRSGQFDVESGFEHWILKFDGMGADTELGGSQDYGRIEYACHLMALEAGIAMSPSRLLFEGGRAHFMTRRFDREGGKKHHLASLCAMSHLDYKQKATHSYGQYLETVARLGLGYAALEEAFRRMVFNVMLMNCDDHTKNLSFLLKEGGKWELAPAYDVTFAHNPQGEWTRQHLMSVNGKFADITEADMLAVADRFGIGTARKVLKQVSKSVDRWPEFAEATGVSTREKERILGILRGAAGRR